MKKKLLLLGASSLISFILLEAAIGLGAGLGLFPIKVPTYSVDQSRASTFWLDINPDFGVWHPSRAATRHTKSCFDVTYHSNSHGARDVERTMQSDRPRVVVLGDSMTEGYGVEDAQRFTNILEKETGIEHLNFGTSGTFGTTQYYLLYKALARTFSHSAVLIGMLPTNDFWDNDIEYGKAVFPDRYRPYLVGEYPNYRLSYYQKSIEQSVFRDSVSWRSRAARILAEFTYSYNAFAYFKQLVAARKAPVPAEARRTREQDFFRARPASGIPSRPYSGFYDYRKDQLDLVKYTFAQIKQLAGSREVVVVLLPVAPDFARFDPAAPVTPLSTELGQFAEASGMKLVDLLPEMYARVKAGDNYILPCDGHWNAQGQAAAARYQMARLALLYGRLAR